jgi:hypothetical protein
MLKKSPGMSFQRPLLAGFDDANVTADPLHSVYGFAHQMMLYTRTWDGLKRYYKQPQFVRQNIRWELLRIFKAVLRDYLAGGSDALRDKMSREEYLRFVDEIESENGED